MTKKKPTPKRTRPNRAAKRKRAAKPAGVGVGVLEMGRPDTLSYVAKDGKRYAHDFGRHARLYATTDGSKLIISGVQARTWIEG